MKRTLKEFNNSYLQNLAEIPTRQLKKIVHNKQLIALENLDMNTGTVIEDFMEIDEIMKAITFKKRHYILPSLYNATLTHHIYSMEKNYKENRKKELIHSLRLLLDVLTLKEILNDLDSFKKTGNSAFLDSAQSGIQNMLKLNENYIQKFRKDLDNFKLVIDGKIPEKEIYRSKMDFKEAAEYPLYNKEIFHRVYSEEKTFSSHFGDDILFKRIINDY